MGSLLAGRTALVTGGSRGIGEAIVRRLHAEGANVAITDVLAREGRALASTLGERAIFLEHDVGSDLAWGDAVAATVSTFGRLDILVNNAGIYEAGTIAEADLAGVERQFRVNQLGVFLGMRHAHGAMREAGGGSIVNISSIAGLKGLPASAAYVATKWAVRGMTKTAALEFVADNIRVNSIHPGYIDTPILDGVDPEALRAGIDATPMKRLGKPEEIAAAVAWLAGADATFATGAELTVDGGYVL